MKRIVIVGGGSAGWMTACFIKKKLKKSKVTLIESPKVNTIGVGESVTVHVTKYLDELGIDETHMMRETNSVYKFGNNFVDWNTGNGENELFPFRWNINQSDMRRAMNASVTAKDGFTALKNLHSFDLQTYFAAKENNLRLTDFWLELYKKNKVGKYFAESYSGYTYFSEHEKMPALNNKHLFAQKGLQHAYHINAEKFGDYLKEHVGLPNGVKHKVAHITDVVLEGKNVKSIKYDGGELEADIFIDCTGFNRVLVNKLDRQWKHYDLMPADSAIVCQVNYNNPKQDLVNHTLSIAQKQGWVFDISLYHRKGTGYIYSSDLCDEDEIMEEYTTNFLSNSKSNPRKITWNKKRLVNSAEGNVIAVGMSNGFIEPMEANLFAIILNCTSNLTEELRQADNVRDIDWSVYNNKIATFYDDIADFILVHYTLSNRPGKFWDEMRSIGVSQNHRQLLIDKYMSANNSFFGSGQGYSLFPDYMWLQLAIGWNVPIDDWPTKPISDASLNLAEKYLNAQNNHSKSCSEAFPNNYEYLRDNIFNVHS